MNWLSSLLGKAIATAVTALAVDLVTWITSYFKTKKEVADRSQSDSDVEKEFAEAGTNPALSEAARLKEKEDAWKKYVAHFGRNPKS